MLRFLAHLALNILANAVGLFAASALLDGFSINGAAFVLAVLIFSLATSLLGPFITKTAHNYAPYLLGGISLVNIFVGLILTTLLSDGISISGLTTWVMAALIIWVFSVIANLVLPLLIFKSVLSDAKIES